MADVRTTTASLAASTLQRAGMISYHRGKNKLTDRQALEVISCECYGAIRRNVEFSLNQCTRQPMIAMLDASLPENEQQDLF